jgi:hypothetical protein
MVSFTLRPLWLRRRVFITRSIGILGLVKSSSAGNRTLVVQASYKIKWQAFFLSAACGHIAMRFRFIWHRIGTAGGRLWTRQWIFGFCKWGRKFWNVWATVSLSRTTASRCCVSGTLDEVVCSPFWFWGYLLVAVNSVPSYCVELRNVKVILNFFL